MSGVFSDLRVLDLSSGVAGPMTTMLLADSGADVIKIEPTGGDPFRFQLGYKVWQRGKRSIVLDLKKPEDLQVFLQLADGADILVESYKPGETKLLGIDYDTLSKRNPRLIYATITGYGEDSKDSSRRDYDALVATRCGVQWEQRGWPEGQLNHMGKIPDPYPDLEIPYDWVQGPPRPGPVFGSAPTTSLGAFYSLEIALHGAIVARERTGEGQKVDTTLVQGAMASLSGNWQRAEKTDAPMFNTWVHCSKSPKGHFKTSDNRWIHNWVPNPRFIMQSSEGDTINASPDLTVQNDPDRFGMGPEELFVMAHYQPILAERVAKFTADEWVGAAATAGMTLQEVRSPEASLADPAFVKEGCVVTIDDPEIGKFNGVGVVIELEKTPGAVQGVAPAPDQHGAEIRAEAPRKPQAPVAPQRSLKHPLSGVRVLDLGLAVAGPFGTQLLAELGADVIKINAPYDFYWHRNHIAMVCNRSKRSIAMDLKDPRAMKILHELVQTADVVQHNMRYDAAIRLGVDYESLKKINPKLIYCHTRGFDRSRMHLPGNDQTGACLAGNQYEEGAMANGGKPLWPFTSFGDTGNGYLSAIGIMQALYHRDRTGEGQFVGTSIVNAQLLNASSVIARPDGEGFDRPRLDITLERLTATYGMYEAADGWLTVAAITEDDWSGLARLLNISDARFATKEARKTNNDALVEVLKAAFKAKNVSEWAALFEANDIAAEISNPNFGQNLHEDPEMVKRGWVVSFDHPEVGRLDQIGDAASLSKTPGVIQSRPLIVAEKTREILAELGYAEEEIDGLKAANVISTWQEGETHTFFLHKKWFPNQTATEEAKLNASKEAAS